MTRFEKLEGYPAEIKGRFNSFLTTQFDDSLSVEMQMRSLIKWITTTRDLVNDFVDYLNLFIEQYDERLQEQIVDTLNEWLEDGTLADVINQEVFDMKVDRSEFEEKIATIETELKENLTKFKEETTNEVNAFKEKITETLEETVLNGKDFGLTGIEGDNVTQKMIALFDYATEINADTVILPEGIHTVDGQELIYYTNDNSTLICYGEIKLNDYGQGMRGSIINFRASNVLIKGLKVNGNRRNNQIDEQRGTQFNIASYGRKNVVFDGGYSKNAIQCSYQGNSSIYFKDFLFHTAGEHHMYITATNEGIGGDYAKFENCEFYNWALALSGGAISARDHFVIKGTNLKMIIDDGIEREGAYYICARKQRDLISDVEKKHHIYERLFCRGALSYRGIYGRHGYHLTIRDSDIEGYIASIDGAHVTVENSVIRMPLNYTNTPEPANRYLNCEFHGGRFKVEQPFEMRNCEIYANKDTLQTFVTLQSVEAGGDMFSVIEGNTFYNFARYFTDDDTKGIIHSKATAYSNRNLIRNNNFVNCGNLMGINSINRIDIVTGNQDMTREGVYMKGNAKNENVKDNSLVDKRA